MVMDDEMRIIIEVPDLSNISELIISMDVDPSTNDFQKNYFFSPKEAPQEIPGRSD